MVAEIQERFIASAFSGDGCSLFNALPSLGNGRFRPFQIVSLREMLVPVFPVGLYVDSSFVRGLQAAIRNEIKKHGDGDNATPAEHLERLKKVLEGLRDTIDGLGFQRTTERLATMDVQEFSTLSVLLYQLEDLDLAILADLKERSFFYMPIDHAPYYEQDALFGQMVEANFPSTTFDVQEAGNCYATGRYTACVFHCMRVVEKGLHALVRDLNAKFGASIIFNKDIEFMNWGNIIDKIEKEMGKLLNPNRTPPLTPNDLTFYSQASKEFVYFKNAWRDDVSHSRSSYEDPNETKAILDHVKAFMRHLATKLKE